MRNKRRGRSKEPGDARGPGSGVPKSPAKLITTLTNAFVSVSFVLDGNQEGTEFQF